MSRIFISLAVVLMFACTQTTATWASVHHRVHAQTAEVTLTFRVHAAQSPPAGTTFWVAYGPVDGKFGLVNLRPIGNHLYQAHRSFPASERTIFAILAGQGSINTPFGLAPGDPVQTLTRFGPVTVDRFHPAQVEWHAPIG